MVKFSFFFVFFCKAFIYFHFARYTHHIQLQKSISNRILFCKCLRNRFHLVNVSFNISYNCLVFFKTHLGSNFKLQTKHGIIL